MRRYLSGIILFLLPVFLILSLPDIVFPQQKKKLKKTVTTQTPAVDAGSRIALIIGNSNYDFSPLKNPVNDASDMASALQSLGFNVILKKNADLQTMEEALEDFGNRLKRGGVGLFFYAGHGVQVQGTNYLIPVGAKINKESDVKFKTVDANRVFAEMENANNGLNIVIMDACRDNPFKQKFRSVQRGLAIVSDAPIGTFIAYSTSPGKVAADGDGRNSPYTAALLDYIKEPGLAIEDVFKSVRQKLSTETGGKQTPWELSSLQGNFYFQPSKATDKVASIALPGELSKGSFSLDDLEKKGQQIEANRAAWSKKLNDMKLAYNKVVDYQKRDVTTDLKLSAWQRFLDSFPEKNPYSSEDDALKNTARQQIEYLAMARRPEPTSGKDYKDPTAGIELVFVKGGCFEMGDTFGEGSSDEKPVHEVCVDDFYMGKYEVTQGQWRQIMGNNPSYFQNCGNTCPVEQVSWNDIKSFIQILNQKTGKRYRLPTEAEWEYACRSGGKREKFAGMNDESELSRYAWYNSNSGSKTHPVGEKQPNGLGLYDMSGNVWEWIADWYDAAYYKDSPKNNPQGPSSASFRARVIRGGSCSDGPTHLRCSDRPNLYFDPLGRNNFGIGFRLAGEK